MSYVDHSIFHGSIAGLIYIRLLFHAIVDNIKALSLYFYLISYKYQQEL